MTTLLRATAVAMVLALAAPAAAQYAQPMPPSQPQMQLAQPETYRHVARINVGVGFYNNGWYNCYYGYYYGSCTSGSYTSFVPFLVGPQIDLGLSRGSALSIGVNAAIGTVTYSYYNALNQYLSASKDVTLWEPTVDYVARFGPPTADTLSRLRIGGAMYFGPNSGFGGAFRIGGGASFLNTNRLGIGIDIVLEAGSYQGYWIGGLQLLVSPEYHF
jgi:hypothetical protein